MLKKEKIIGIIPARLNSKRLANKLLLKINKTTILEHVINRLLLSKVFSKIIIVSPDDKVRRIANKFSRVDFFKSLQKHSSGTSRSFEAVKDIKFSKLVVIFGDEPLIRPNEIAYFTKKISNDKKNNIWNATININDVHELHNKSIVKCYTDRNNYITDLKRSCDLNLDSSLKKGVLKSVGLIAFKYNVIKNINLRRNKENIEQLNFINNKFLLKSIKLKHNFFSINTSSDLIKVKTEFKHSKIQKKINSLYKLNTNI